MLALFFLLLGLTNLVVTHATYAFISVGDWGGSNVGYQQSQYAVAAQMATLSSEYNSQFVLALGDNFYWCGIQNATDVQIDVDYVQPYKAASLQVPWYSTLGNHEYGYNVDAQIEYTKLSNTWYMPSRYYTKRIQMSGENYLTIIVLDTSPCVTQYRSSDPNNWDPCYPTYPTCSPTSTDDDFEGPCKFYENIISQDCSVQYNWFKNTLLAVPKSDWLIIMGHHPIDEVTEKDFISPMQQRGFSLYLNGHTHLLNQYTIDNAGSYFTTGAGAMVRTADQEHAVTAAKLKGEHVGPEDMLKMTGATTGHSYHTVATHTVPGFLLHAFNDDFTQLTTQMINVNTASAILTYTSDRYGNQVV